jgi:enamine deaminase RidA (YjgF/YER057c/UK114 family)
MPQPSARLGRLLAGLGVVLAACPPAACASAARDPAGRYVNPPGLVKPSGYTHVVVAAEGRTACIADRVAFDSTGRVVGAGDFRAQTEQVFANLRRALSSVGASFGDVVKTTTYLTDAAQGALVREVRAKYFDPTRPPANTLVPVPALARPELMIEIEAVAVLPPR